MIRLKLRPLLMLLSLATIRAFRGPLSRSCKVSGVNQIPKSIRYPFAFSRSFCATKNDNSDAKIGTTNRTVKDAWSSTLEQFQQQGVSEPDWSVAHLLASVLDLPWSNGFSQIQRAMVQGGDEDLSKRQLTETEWNKYQSMVERRLQDEPLQYILGKWDFLDYQQLRIRPPLLCPRPETEELVELVHKDIMSGPTVSDALNILDVGCGTGVIGIALADKLPSCTVVGIDIEPVAVATSMENANLVLGGDSQRYSSMEISVDDYETDLPIDVLVSNPPYIPRPDMASLSKDVVQYESDQALCGGDDGMDVIRTIVRKWATEWGKRPHGTCWMEVDPTHPSLLQSWLDTPEQRTKLGVHLESSHQDLSGRDRFIKLGFRK